MAYAHLRSITINHLKVGSDLTNYPVCINGTYSYLKTVANGGSIVNTVTVSGITVPADLIFTTETYPAGTVILDFEIEYYSPTTGAIVAWVNVPAVSSIADTVFFMRYGNAAVTTWQGDVTGTWPSAFKAVWHLSGDQLGIVNPNMDDSTSNNNDGTASGLSNQLTTVGQVDGGCYFTGGGTGIGCGTSSSVELQSWSASFWVNSNSIGEFGTNHAILTVSDTGMVTTGWGIVIYHDAKLRVAYYNGANVEYFSSFTFSVDTWYFITVTYNAATGALLIYKDGVLVDTVAASAGTIIYASDTIHIGGGIFNGGAASYAGQHGIIDEVRIYSGVQSTGWQLTEYNNEFSPSTFYTISGDSTPFTAACGSPPDGTAGEIYSHTFPTPTDGGSPPFFWAIVQRDATSFVPEDVMNNITLSPFTAIFTGYPAEPGIWPFTLLVVDTVSFTASVDCSITIADGATPDTHPDWRVPPDGGWDFTSACAREGSGGLRHVADGTDVVGNSRVANLTAITVEAGWTLYLSFWLKGSGGADGAIALGMTFFDVDNTFISEAEITSTGSPTTWTQFQGNITVPADAVTAIPFIQAIGHLTGTWCIDDVFATHGGGHFVLSSVKEYRAPYALYRA